MKDYINLLFSIIDKIDNWEKKNDTERTNTLKLYLVITKNEENILKYFEKYRLFLAKNPFNNLSKDIIRF